MNRCPLLVALGAVAAAQAVSGIPQRVDLWKDVVRFARMENDEARLRAAYAPASYDLLEKVRRETPPTARILLATDDRVLYHRALVHLYPRAVRWVRPEAPAGWPVFWTRSDVDPSSLEREARRWRATAIVAGGALHFPLVEGR